jgi:hypothetical protein
MLLLYQLLLLLLLLLLLPHPCRGPFTGDKMVQAHLCGRLPRDTLVVGLNPELPPSLLCMDVAYYFRYRGGGGGCLGVRGGACLPSDVAYY